MSSTVPRTGRVTTRSVSSGRREVADDLDARGPDGSRRDRRSPGPGGRCPPRACSAHRGRAAAPPRRRSAGATRPASVTGGCAMNRKTQEEAADVLLLEEEERRQGDGGDEEGRAQRCRATSVHTRQRTLMPVEPVEPERDDPGDREEHGGDADVDADDLARGTRRRRRGSAAPRRSGRPRSR